MLGGADEGRAPRPGSGNHVLWESVGAAQPKPLRPSLILALSSKLGKHPVDRRFRDFQPAGDLVPGKSLAQEFSCRLQPWRRHGSASSVGCGTRVGGDVARMVFNREVAVAGLLRHVADGKPFAAQRPYPFAVLGWHWRESTAGRSGPGHSSPAASFNSSIISPSATRRRIAIVLNSRHTPAEGAARPFRQSCTVVFATPSSRDISLCAAPPQRAAPTRTISRLGSMVTPRAP